ncbi:hypothetical protein [Pedobacter sp. L105]|uniref:hypothetical protein n=1 Tax=Pedobacter sp. L105 TaxID=1641871 RepID=UPI00131BE71D|nr:hypothetical protein [Pedobacter sp. L105]
MNAKGQIILNYTDEFKIACKINNLHFEELLQYFIDHVSFYAFIGGNMESVYLWATTVSIDCKDFQGGQIETITDQRIQQISLKYIRKLTSLNLEPDLPESLETNKSVTIMREWAAEMLPLTDYLSEIKTQTGELLQLTFDFNMLCRMNGIEVQHLLQYFISTISLARERAVNLLTIVKADPSTAVLLFLVGSHEEVKDKILPQQDVYKQYGLKLLRLDRKLKEVKDLETRIKIYSSFYREWYNALQSDIN